MHKIKLSRPTPAMLWGLLALVISAAFALLSHWQIFETDIFWQCRAGEEIIRNHSLTTHDTWTSTVARAPWYNFQWLSEVSFYFFSRLGHAPFTYLPSLRSFLIFILLGETCLLIHRNTSTRQGLWISTLLLLPWFYLTCYGRFQLRPDIFGEVIFCAWLLNRKSFWPSVILLVAWANFHGGTYPIGLAIIGLEVLGEPSHRTKAWKIATLLTAGLLTPIGFHVYQEIARITLEYDWRVIHNPDHLPFSWDLLDVRQYGWSYLLWFVGGIAFFAGWILTRGRKIEFLSALALFLLTLMRIRARVYSALFMIPLLAQFIERGLQARRRTCLTVTVALIGLEWLYCVPALFSVAPPLGFGINTSEFPVQTVRFLNERHPRGNLLNYYDYGGYLIQFARDYPVAQDGREYIFKKFFEEKAKASEDPNAFAEFLRRNRFDIILGHSSNQSPEESEAWYPKSEWALVARDPASILLIRRTAENLSLIQATEIHP